MALADIAICIEKGAKTRGDFDTYIAGLMARSDLLLSGKGVHKGDLVTALADLTTAILVVSADPVLAATLSKRPVFGGLSELELGGANVPSGGTLMSHLYDQRAMVFLARKQFSPALQDANRAISLSPKNPNAYNVRGIVFSGMLRKQNALSDYSEAIRLGPTMGPWYINRSEIYKAFGQLDAANRDMQMCCRETPGKR